MRLLLALLAMLVAAPAVSAARRPSPSACAISWNDRAGPRLHKAVAKADVKAAFIDARASVGVDTLSATGSSSSTSRGCSIDFVLPAGGGLMAWGRWRAGTVVAWRGSMRFNRSFPVPHNARVYGDGTLGFTG